jgi:5-methylcytosine-specific restriction enzyme A
MPTLAAKPCRQVGCNALVRDGGGYCAAHKREVKREVESRRVSSTQRGYGYQWQKARAGYLRSHPLCVRHQERNELVQATVVDHKVPHKLDEAMSSGDAAQIAKAKDLFWDHDNWQPLCKQCHDEKTAREDGAFGNPRQAAG